MGVSRVAFEGGCGFGFGVSVCDEFGSFFVEPCIRNNLFYVSALAEEEFTILTDSCFDGGRMFVLSKCGGR